MLEVFKGLAACGLCMKLERVVKKNKKNKIKKNKKKINVKRSGGLWVVYEVGESCNQATKQSHRIFCNLPFLSVVDQDERE